MVFKSNNIKNNTDNIIFEYNNNIEENYAKNDYFETKNNAKNYFDIRSLECESNFNDIDE
jgi:secreted Zn-dependent insulinase-like peptidase